MDQWEGKEGEKEGEELGESRRQRQINLKIWKGIAKFIIPMLKNQTVNTNPHQLVLNKVCTHCPELALTVTFQLPSKSPLATGSIVPRFNADKLHFTPAFLLPCDERFCKENTSFERIRFDQKIQNAQEKSIIEVGLTAGQNNKKAGPPSNYCQLCKTHYIDYQQHIRLAAHRHLQTNNSANQYIQELTHLFQKRPQRRRQIAKKTEKTRAECKGKKQGKRKMKVEEEVKRLATCSKSSNISTNMEQQLV